MKLIKEILKLEAVGQKIEIRGWVKSKRESKNLIFLSINDGSCFASIQATLDRSSFPKLEEEAKRLSTGASCKITGCLQKSPSSGQDVEVVASKIEVYGEADPKEYPLQKKNHSFEFLREVAHLRARTNTFSAVARVRSRISYAIHNFFQQKGFHYVHTPIITGSDCEGAGEEFQVTTLDMEALVKTSIQDALKKGDMKDDFKIDYTKDFFGKKTYLTVSGQLSGETYATALSRIYTFAPTFRAENSNTTRHLAEFWMIEPEMAFFRLKDNEKLAEDFVKYILKDVLKHCMEDLKFFDERVKKGLIETLQKTLSSPFVRLTYTEAIKELEKSKKKFEYPVSWGANLQSEHERYLTEEVFKAPLIVRDYPKDIKAFYMKLNKDGKTVGAMDVLVPSLGEIIGGSEREDSYDVLSRRIKEMNLNLEDYWWYLELRKYGTVPHSGFGLGLERLVSYVTGMNNVRDVIPFPRFPKGAEF